MGFKVIIYYRLNQRDRTVEVMEFWHSARLEPEFHERSKG